MKVHRLPLTDEAAKRFDRTEQSGKNTLHSDARTVSDSFRPQPYVPQHAPATNDDAWDLRSEDLAAEFRDKIYSKPKPPTE